MSAVRDGEARYVIFVLCRRHNRNEKRKLINCVQYIHQQIVPSIDGRHTSHSLNVCQQTKRFIRQRLYAHSYSLFVVISPEAKCHLNLQFL